MRSILTAIRQDTEIQRLLAAHPKTWRFISRRFSRAEPLGLRLTIGAAMSLVFVYLFFSVVEDLIFKDPLVGADVRVISLLQILREPAFNHVMLFITYLGNWQIVVAGVLLFGAYLALSQRWLWLTVLLISVVGGEGVVWAIKTLVGRQRPDLANALAPAQGPSFPSGHAFVAFAFFGLVAWFAISHANQSWKRLSLVLLAAIGIAALGFSRVYLGVHWPSDVLASFAAGAAWLTMLVTALAVADAYGIQDHSKWARKVSRKTVITLLLLVWVGVVVAYYETHPLMERERPTPQFVALQQENILESLFAQVPRFSEDIAGTPMEPINVIVIGSEDDLTKTLAASGWQRTDPITMKSAWRLFVATLLDRNYSQAPGIPAFWNGKPNELAFARPTARQSARERHHLHIWDTSFTANGQPVWLGTAHFDKLASAAAQIPLPMHEIDPNVDREREALRTSLLATHCVDRISEVQVTDPMLGHNAFGSSFFTDGKAVIIKLKCE